MVIISLSHYTNNNNKKKIFKIVDLLSLQTTE